MMTPESKATTATTTKTSTMALAQKTAAAAASQSTSTSSSSLHLSTLGIASKAAKAAKSFVSNMHNNNNNNNNTNRNNNNNNNNSSSKKLASVEKMQMQMHKQQQQQQQQHQRQQQQQQQNFAAKSIKVKSENVATATNAFTQSTTTTATAKALLECRRSNIKKESTPPATATTTATPAAAASADAGSTTTSFAPSFSSSSSSSSSSAWSTIEDANSNGGASADEEPTIEREPPKAATTTATAASTAASSEQETSLSMMMTTPRPVLLTAVNPHIICHLCQGYLINATTIVECLHSFCHNCLINHLHKERYCPRCEMVINNAKPNIKSDTTLQAIVYKLVPGLYERELMRKRAFYKDRPQEAALATPEQRGDDTEHLIFSPSDDMSLSLEYAELGELSSETEVEFGDTLRPRYLQCPAMCRVSHLKKFVYDKFEIDAQRFSIDIMYKVKTIVLLDYYTLMDIAYIYTWKRDAPMRFYFRVYESPKPLIKPPPPPPPVVIKAPVKQEPLTEAPATPPSPPAAAPTVSPAPPPAPPLLTPPVLVVKTATPSPPLLQPARIKVEQQTTTQDEFRIVPKLNSPTDQPLKLVINRQSVEKREKSPHDKHHHHHSHHHNHQYSPKGSSHKSLPSPSYNKEEPNIKLKIDLSKHNSVTIINMSDPDRREIVKPLKPEKESRSKSKKDKDGSPKSSSSHSSSSSSSSSERKRKSPSPLTVPPLTIRTDRILSPNGVRTVLSPRVTSGACHEDPKSAFLKSFALTPIKVKVESPERSNGHAHQAKPHLDDSLLMKPPSSMAPKSIASSKRKSKEPIKAISSKKPKLSPPLPREDFKIRLPAAAPAPAPAPSADKPLMPPPSGKPPIAAARHKSSATPQLPAPLQSPALPFATPPHHQGMQMAPPGNRTPIAKRYQPILPKASRPNPFANIPSDVNRLLKDAGTEIKSIASQAKPHIYGPKSQELKMGPPPAPISKSNSSSSNNNSNNNNNNKSNNYLNLALFNASKSKGKEAPPGCRTPMYTPNSPIYSPSSPQYVPNYNIPTMPTYKYTPKPTTTTNTTPTSSTTTTTTSSNNYLQNMLNGSSNSSGLGGLFPSPPTKADQNTNPGSAEDAPEKQQVKVKSLLNSCNINIPSSLSITISRDNGDASSPSNAAHAKHKSPVNNYIEIVKLPDQPAAVAPPASSPTPIIEKEQPVKKLPAPPSKTIPSPQHLLARMTPPQLSNPTTTTTVVPPKSSPKLAAPKPPAVLTPQQSSDKKTPSPEKRSASSALSPNSGENKSPKSSQATNGTANGGDPAAKKFRPILPRQNAAAAGGASELSPKLSAQPPSLSPGYNNNNNNSNNNNKKVPTSKKSPNGANAKLMLNGGGTPTAPKPNALQKKKHAATTPTTKMPPPSTAHPHLPNMNAPLGIASAANQLDLSNFLMRAQAAQAAQVAAQAANPANLLYNFGPSMYNYQQAYLMEQLSRMQRAGNEVFNDYLQKLKSNASSLDEQQHSKSVMPMLPTVTLPTATMQGGGGGGAASPKTSPHATAAKLTPAATPALAKRQPSPRPQAAATSNNNNNNNAMTKTK